mmetsp:Transcript_57360/g.113876  ORF Transcript_57360/g.113876 Transcript_57360/m.113876 type:complete len:260 (-) Transcript_57360:1333-2112(-)
MKLRLGSLLSQASYLSAATLAAGIASDSGSSEASMSTIPICGGGMILAVGIEPPRLEKSTSSRDSPRGIAAGGAEAVTATGGADDDAPKSPKASSANAADKDDEGATNGGADDCGASKAEMLVKSPKESPKESSGFTVVGGGTGGASGGAVTGSGAVTGTGGTAPSKPEKNESSVATGAVGIAGACGRAPALDVVGSGASGIERAASCDLVVGPSTEAGIARSGAAAAGGMAVVSSNGMPSDCNRLRSMAEPDQAHESF